MKIGFTTLLSYRPHVEHMFYLSQQFKKSGHDVFHLNCKGHLPTCYNLKFKAKAKSIECLKCRAGSLYSFTKENNTFIQPELAHQLCNETLNDMSFSSSCTLTRIEDPQDIDSAEVKNLQKQLGPAVAIVYSNTKNWITSTGLDFVFFFNGRIDITRAVMQACEDTQTKFCAVERTLFAHGLQLNFGNNSLALKEIHNLSLEFQEKPLLKEQALLAAELLTSRFRRSENLEWRNYNKESKKMSWPRDGQGLKILILPSSKNEVLGQHDWRNEWEEYSKIFEQVIQKIGGDYSNCILRGHPNWAQRIGVAGGEKIFKYYHDWCQVHDILMIGSASNVSTSHLIAQADVVLLNGSSAVYEASILGTPSICVARCRYQHANLAKVLLSQEELDNFRPSELFARTHEDLLRSLLRFFYSYAVRYAIFNSFIRASSIYQFHYAETVDIKRLLDMMKSYKLIPDDTRTASSTHDEDEIIELILKKDWHQLKTPKLTNNSFKKISRRGAYIFVDRIRSLFKRGDL